MHFLFRTVYKELELFWSCLKNPKESSSHQVAVINEVVVQEEHSVQIPNLEREFSSF